MRFPIMRAAVFLVLFLRMAAAGRADVVVKYDFTGSPGNQASEAPEPPLAHITAGNLVRGSGVSPSSSAGTNTINSIGWTEANSINANDYYGFTVTPQSGWSMTLTNISFAEGRGSAGPRDLQIRTSLDNFAASIYTTAVNSEFDDPNNHSVNLNAAFANLTSTLTFRIYGYDSTDDVNGTWRLFNHSTNGGLVLMGTVAAVPEASPFLFGGIICGVLGVWRAWRSRQLDEAKI